MINVDCFISQSWDINVGKENNDMKIDKNTEYIEVDCRRCTNCTGESCRKYGNNPDVATKHCANDNFKNYTMVAEQLKENK